MLEGLDEVDWSRLNHPYGDAGDVPGLIRDLASDDEEARSDAREMLSDRLCEYGEIEVTTRAIPFLNELAAQPDVEERDEILEFLAGLARERRTAMRLTATPAGERTTSAPRGARGGGPGNGRRAVRRGRRRDLPGPAGRRESAGPARRRLRAGPVRGPGGAADPRPRRPHQGPSRSQYPGRADHGGAFARCGRGRAGAVNLVLAERMRPEEHPVVRMVAAVCLAGSSPGARPAKVVETLCATTEAAWRDFEDIAGEAGYRMSQALGGDPEALFRILLGPLDSRDPYVRNGARNAAAQLCHERRAITPRVAAALGDRLGAADLEDRRQITEILSRLGAASAAAAGPLAAALGDDDPEVRTGAAIALAGLCDPRALPVLIERLDSYRTTSISTWEALRDLDSISRIAEALGRLGAAAGAAVPTLLDLLKGPRGELFHGKYRPLSIIPALGRIGPDAWPAASALIALMKEEPMARLTAAKAIGQIGGPEARSAIPLLERLLRSADEADGILAAEALWRIDGRAGRVLPVLIERLSADDSCNSMAAEVLGAMGGAAREAVPVLVACLEDTSLHARWVHLEAAVALWRIEHRVDRALPVLAALLRDPGAAGARVATRAAEALGEIGAEAREAAPILREAAAGDLRPFGGAADEIVTDDDAFLSAVAGAIRRIEGGPQVRQGRAGFP